MQYYTVNALERRIYEDETDNVFDEDDARSRIKEYTDRIDELEDCLQVIDRSYGVDPMDLAKEKMMREEGEWA